MWHSIHWDTSSWLFQQTLWANISSGCQMFLHFYFNVTNSRKTYFSYWIYWCFIWRLLRMKYLHVPVGIITMKYYHERLLKFSWSCLLLKYFFLYESWRNYNLNVDWIHDLRIRLTKCFTPKQSEAHFTVTSLCERTLSVVSKSTYRNLSMGIYFYTNN